MRNKSVDQLENSKPNNLLKELTINENELCELLDYLYDKGVIAYKYNIICQECTANHTIYETELHNKFKICECGKHIYFDKVIKNSEFLIIIDKREVLDLCTSVDYAETIYDNIISIHKRRGSMIREDDNNEIFIGSSTQAKDQIDDIAVIIEEEGFTALPWNASGKGVFRASNYTLENLLNVSNRVRAAIFIFNDDDETWYSSSNIKHSTTRDNVLFEYGLFIGKKGRANVIFITKGNPKVASDLSGVTYIDASQPYHMKAELKDWLQSLNLEPIKKGI